MSHIHYKRITMTTKFLSKNFRWIPSLTPDLKSQSLNDTGTTWSTVFTSGSVITSVAMYNSDIGMAGTGRNTGTLYYSQPGKESSPRTLYFSITLHSYDFHHPTFILFNAKPTKFYKKFLHGELKFYFTAILFFPLFSVYFRPSHQSHCSSRVIAPYSCYSWEPYRCPYQHTHPGTLQRRYFC